MSFISGLLHHTMVYWGPSTPDGFGGRSFSSPVEIKGRWEWKQEVYIGPDLREHRSQAIAYFSTDMAVGGYLYYGDEDTLPSDHVNPTEIEGTYEIKAYQKTADVFSTSYLRKVWM